ncbi:hypothetical protein ACFPM0_26790 [Pseudonocardia sulfidoxydans]
MLRCWSWARTTAPLCVAALLDPAVLVDAVAVQGGCPGCAP